MSRARETKEIIARLNNCVEWFKGHGKNTNTAVIGICTEAAERLADLEKIAEFYRRKLEGKKQTEGRGMRAENIKFRGKRTLDGEWVEGYLTRKPSAIQYGGKYSSWYIERPPSDPDDSGGIYNVDRETVGQFTGLEDKEGGLKWEGDIFIFGEHIYIIEWDEEERAFIASEPFEPDYSINLSSFTADEIAVIGNIHDNPELIK